MTGTDAQREAWLALPALLTRYQVVQRAAVVLRAQWLPAPTLQDLLRVAEA